MKTTFKMTVVLAMAALAITGCRPGSSSPDPNPAPDGKTFNVSLTDGPANYKRLSVEITGVEVYHDTRGWIPLSTTVRAVEILTLSNGASTNIATNSHVAPGHYSLVRVRFSDNNNVTVNAAPNITGLDLEAGGTAHLQWAHETNYVEIKIDEQVTDDAGADVMLDFDAEKSVREGMGAFYLDPVITNLTDPYTGVRGTVTGGNAAALIKLTDGPTSFSAYASFEGRFYMRGMVDGRYSATVKVMKRNPDSGLMEEKTYTRDDVVVSRGRITDMGTIRF